MLLLLGAAALGIVYGLLRWRFECIRSTTYGSAQWAYVWDVFRRGHFRDKGLKVGDWTGQLTVHYDGTHAISFGHSGSGKGVSAILPNLLSYRWVFLIDPGGENTAIAAKWWRQEKMQFACINIDTIAVFIIGHRHRPSPQPANSWCSARLPRP
jgi:type IV secretion system protein VirD4